MTDTLIFIGIIAAGVIALLLVIMALLKFIPWLIDIVKDIKEKKRIKKEYPSWSWEQKWQYYEQQAFLNCTDPEYHVYTTDKNGNKVPTKQFVKDLGHEPTEEEIVLVNGLYAYYSQAIINYTEKMWDASERVKKSINKTYEEAKQALINKEAYSIEEHLHSDKNEIDEYYNEFISSLKTRSYVTNLNRDVYRKLMAL